MKRHGRILLRSIEYDELKRKKQIHDQIPCFESIENYGPLGTQHNTTPHRKDMIHGIEQRKKKQMKQDEKVQRLFISYFRQVLRHYPVLIVCFRSHIPSQSQCRQDRTGQDTTKNHTHPFPTQRQDINERNKTCHSHSHSHRHILFYFGHRAPNHLIIRSLACFARGPPRAFQKKKK